MHSVVVELQTLNAQRRRVFDKLAGSKQLLKMYVTQECTDSQSLRQYAVGAYRQARTCNRQMLQAGRQAGCSNMKAGMLVY